MSSEPATSLIKDTCADRRLQPAARLLESEQISVLSLDVFDTMLWRIVPEPVDVFVLFGEKLREFGYLHPSIDPTVFARLRESAEQRARSFVRGPRGAQEITIETIYAHMPAHLLRDAEPSELVDMEVEFEAEITFPDLEVLALAKMAQRRFGARVVLVSDTYFSQLHLRRILDRSPFSEIKIHRIFTSSEHKVGKGFGLFERVVAELGCPPEQVLHVGDHEISDVASPSKIGIHAVHFERFAPGTSEVLERERVLQTPRGVQRAPIDPRCGDSGLSAMRSKSLHRAERDRFGAAARPYWDVGALVFGPVVAGFAEWIHEEATALGFPTVHCLMREGEFLARLVNGAAPSVDSPVKARRLWASRHVTARAAIFEANREELTPFAHRRRPPTVRQFLDGLGVGLAAFPELFTRADSRLDDAELLERVLGMIARRADVRAAITSSAAELRKRLVTYVMRELTEPGRLLVADLGWGATIQANLQRVFEGSGIGIEIHGLYLATNDAAVDRILTGVRAKGFLANAGVPELESALISRSPEVLEQAFMHDVGSLDGFTVEGEPITAEAAQDPVQMLQRSAVQAGMLGFQDEWSRYRALVPKTFSLTHPSTRAQLLRILRRFISRPTQQEALLFSGWLHDDNFGSARTESMITSELGRLVKYMTPEQYLDLPTTKTYWPFGLAAIFEPAMAMFVAAIVDDRVPADAFLLSEQHYMPIYFDDGSGFEEVTRTPVRANGAGLCFAREVLDARAVHAVRLAFPGGPGVVRADWLGLTFHLRPTEEPVRVVVEWPDDFEQLIPDRCVRLTPNVLVGNEQAPQLVYTCPVEWRDEVYRVEIEAAFAWVPTAPFRWPASHRDGLTADLRRAGRKAKRLLSGHDPNTPGGGENHR